MLGTGRMGKKLAGVRFRDSQVQEGVATENFLHSSSYGLKEDFE